jgi:uncharacterized protein (DUF305 family)
MGITLRAAVLVLSCCAVGARTDPALRRLAQEIITEQQSEIEVMQLW